MKTKISFLSVLALALLFGLSTVTFSQGEKKPAKTKKTETVVKTAKTDSTKAMKSGHKKHVKKEATTPEKK